MIPQIPLPLKKCISKLLIETLFSFSAYIHNNFDQFNGPTILMPYGNAPTTTTPPLTTTKDIDAYDTDGLYRFSSTQTTNCNKTYSFDSHLEFHLVQPIHKLHCHQARAMVNPSIANKRIISVQLIPKR